MDTKALENIVSTRGRSSVSGITGEQVPITHHGVAPILGRVNIAPDAKDNLISLISLVNNGYSFCGDRDELTVKDSRGRVVIRGKRNRDEKFDMWKVNLNDLIEEHKANITVSMHGLPMQRVRQEHMKLEIYIAD